MGLRRRHVIPRERGCGSMRRTMRSAGTRHLARCFVAAATVALPRVGMAQDAAPSARALFIEGRKALTASVPDLQRACDLFAESQRLDPSSGTLLNLADCHQRQGKTATAWADFLKAAQLAGVQHRPDSIEEARRRAAELEATLSYLTIEVEQKVPDLKMREGERVLGEEIVGVRLPVDPGPLSIVASAPGFEPWSTNIVIGPKSDNKVVKVPRFTAVATSPPTAPPPAANSQVGQAPPRRPEATKAAEHPSAPIRSKRPVVGYLLGGTGIVLAGAGSVFGILAWRSYGTADHDCPTHVGCSKGALQERSTAETFANLSNVGIGLGAVCVAVGAILVVRSHGEQAEGAKSATVSITARPETGGTTVSLQGRF